VARREIYKSRVLSAETGKEFGAKNIHVSNDSTCAQVKKESRKAHPGK
jgi:hypothetical protein